MHGVPSAFLVVSLVGAGFTLLAFTAPRRPAVLSFPIFMASWVTGDLAWFHIAWQVVATIGFIAFGALRGPAGWAALGVTLASWVGLVAAARWQRRSVPVLATALKEMMSADAREHEGERAVSAAARVVSRRQLLSPFRMRGGDVEVVRDLAYGDNRRHRLDVYRQRDAPPGRPVVFQIHGGAWVVGDKRQQGQPLLHHLAERGWIGVAPNYRRAPPATFPHPPHDVNAAWARVQTHG